MALAELLGALLTMCLIILPVSRSEWQDGHATIYGGANRAAYEYGDEDYGAYTAALSTKWFNDGGTCGGCYEIHCKQEEDPQWCLPGTSVVVTATNIYPPNYALSNYDGGWCNPPLPNFDMAVPAFEQIAKYKAGIVPVLFRRVECKKKRGIMFTMKGNPYFTLVLISNVGGAGDVVSVSVKSSNSNEWEEMGRSWGQNWQFSDSQLVGQSLSFRVTTSDGKSATSYYVVPPHWQFGQTFEGSQL